MELFLFLAQTGDKAAGQGGFSIANLMPFIMLLGFFAIFYFLVIRPQSKKQKELKKQIEEMQKGDKVLTAGGIFATVVKKYDDDSVLVKIAENVEVKVAKQAITQVVNKSGGSE